MLTLEKKFYIIMNAFLLLTAAGILLKAYYFRKKRKSGILLNISLVIAALGLLDIFDMYFVEPNWIKTERVTIHDPELADILAGLTVVQISDIHLKEIGLREKQLVEKINALKPDILFITGDFFSDDSGQKAVDQFKGVSELIRRFKVRVGIYGILGNYDGYLEHHPERLKELIAAGINIVENETRKVSLPNKKVLWLANATESCATQRKSDSAQLKQIIKAVPADSPIILLNHYPDIFGKAYTVGINLVLVGHTHGGQIGIPFLIHMSNSANKSPYMRGLFDSGKTKMYVNRGIGTTNLPVRFLCRPEITVFDFVK